MTAQRPRLADLVVYAPLGLARLCVEQVLPAVRTEITDLRQQGPAARFIGDMAIAQMRTRVNDAARPHGRADCAHRFNDLQSFVMTKLGVPVTSSAHAGEGSEDPTPAVEPTPNPTPAPTRQVAEPSAIPGYRDLSAPQVIALLGDLRPEELAEVEDFEGANRGRRTILNRITTLKGE